MRSRTIAAFLVVSACALASGAPLAGCEGEGGGGFQPTDTDTDADTDGDTDVDSDSDTDSDTDGDTDADTDGDTDSDTDSDADTDGDTDVPECTDGDSDGWCLPFDCDDSDNSVHPGATEDQTNGADDDCDGTTDEASPFGDEFVAGTVWAPSGAFPISGALVYLTSEIPPEIDDGAFCYECENMGGKPWALSGADGSFSITNAPEGTVYLVTRKGFFQRVREITITAGEPYFVPAELSTLPGASAEPLDEIPNYAVLLNSWDQQHDLLAKLGLGDLDSAGDLVWGTEEFAIYNDDVSHSGYPWSSTLFATQETLDQYHMLFFPCTSSYNGVSFVTSRTGMLQTYVSGGGKIYSSCCTALWTEAPFPQYVEYYGSDTADQFDIGRISSSAYSTTGDVLDADMAAWLEIVTGESAASFPFTNGYVKIDGLNDVDDGHGLDEDAGWVIPKAWVEDNGTYSGSPLIVTYNWDCGKIFYSVYETTHVGGAAIQPQEYVLLYVILEVGVCEGDYTIE